MYAIEQNFPEAVKLLLDEEADTYLRDAHSRTATELAEELGEREDIIEMLNEV